MTVTLIHGVTQSHGVSPTHGVTNGHGVTALSGNQYVYPWSPQDIPNIDYWMPAAFTSALYQETYYNVASNIFTPATANNDPVGAVYAPINALSTYATSTAKRPLLTTGNSTNSMLYFGSAGATAMEITNSQQIFDYLYCSYIFTIMLKISMPPGTNGVLYCIMDSINGTGANIGFNLTRAADNTLQVQVGKAGTNSILVNTVRTLTADGLDHNILITCNGSGANALTVQMDNNAAETFTPSAAGSAAGTLSTFSMNIGSRQGSGAPGTFKLSDLIIVNGVMSAANIALYKAYNPARQSTSLLRITPGTGGVITGQSISSLMSWWDMSATIDPKDGKTVLFTDTARTTAVTTDGQNINAVASRQLSSKILRYLTLSSGTTGSPIYKTGIQNGNSIGRFSGSNNGITSTYQAWDLNQQMPPGNKHIFVVVRNNSNGTAGSTGQSGSHLFAQSQTQYMVITGNNYGGNPNRLLTHDSGGVATPNLSNTNGGIGLNINELICIGGTFQMLSCGAQGPVLSDSVNYFSANNIGKNSHQIGGGQEPDATGYWELNGDYMDCYIFQDALPANIAAAFRRSLATKWGIANVV